MGSSPDERLRGQQFDIRPPRPDPGFTNLTRNILHSLDELFEAGEAVRSLQEHPGWTYLSRLIEAKAAEVDAQMDGRLLDSRSEYAYAHGRRSGLRAMADAAHAIVSEADRKLKEQQARHEGTAEPVLTARSQ